MQVTSATLWLSLVALATGVGKAADRVWVEPQRSKTNQSDWYPSAIQTYSGKVIQFDAKQLRLLVAGDEAEKVIAARGVLWIEPENVSELETEAIAMYVEGKFAESLSRLPDILRLKPPVWRQQWITMMAADAARRSGRSKISLELVSQLDRRPLPPIAVAWLPVAWENGVQPADAIAAARARISDPSPAVRLVAASWLLSSPDRNQAVAVLKQLPSQQREEISRYAEILLWRTAPPPEVTQRAQQWQSDLDALPMVLQTGPTRTLIDKLRSAGQVDAASHLQWSLDLTPIDPYHR